MKARRISRLINDITQIARLFALVYPRLSASTLRHARDITPRGLTQRGRARTLNLRKKKSAFAGIAGAPGACSKATLKARSQSDSADLTTKRNEMKPSAATKIPTNEPKCRQTLDVTAWVYKGHANSPCKALNSQTRAHDTSWIESSRE